MKTQFIQKRFHSPDDIESIWQLLYPKHFINTLLIHHIKQQGEDEIAHVASIMRHGLTHHSDDDLSSSNKHIALINDRIKTSKISDIFKSFQNEDGFDVEPKFILIEGAPGMGKTTLCKEIASQWAKGELLKDTKIVFLIYLRDPEVQKICDLKDL